MTRTQMILICPRIMSEFLREQPRPGQRPAQRSARGQQAGVDVCVRERGGPIAKDYHMASPRSTCPCSSSSPAGEESVAWQGFSS